MNPRWPLIGQQLTYEWWSMIRYLDCQNQVVGMWEKANSIGVFSAGENQIPGGTRSTDYPIELVVIHQSPVGPPPQPPTHRHKNLKKPRDHLFHFKEYLFKNLLKFQCWIIMVFVARWKNSGRLLKNCFWGIFQNCTDVPSSVGQFFALAKIRYGLRRKCSC